MNVSDRSVAHDLLCVCVDSALANLPCAAYMLCPNCGSGQSVDCLAQTVDHALLNNPWIVCAICGATLCATQSQAPQTIGEARNRREGLQSAAQGDVRDSYLGLGILHCSAWGLGLSV